MCLSPPWVSNLNYPGERLLFLIRNTKTKPSIPNTRAAAPGQDSAGAETEVGSPASSSYVDVHTGCVAGVGAVIDIELDAGDAGEPYVARCPVSPAPDSYCSELVVQRCQPDDEFAHFTAGLLLPIPHLYLSPNAK